MSSYAEIRAAVSIDDACEALGLGALDRSRKVHCPVHEDVTPSLHLYDDSWHCYGCGAGGDVVDLVAAFTGSSPAKARLWLEGAVPDDVEVAAPRPKRPVVDLGSVYTRERAGKLEDVEALQQLCDQKQWPGVNALWLVTYVGAVKRYAFWIPHYHNGRIVGVKTRSLSPGNLGEKRSVPDSTFTCSLYGVPGFEVKRNFCEAVLVEGESDTWVGSLLWPELQVFGLPSGASTWKDEWIPSLAQYSTVHLCIDNGPAGQKATARIMDRLSRHGVRFVCHELPFDDFSDSIRDGWRPF